MSDLKEYIVTLKDRKDLESFYEDMETEGGNLYIPGRVVELANRAPSSRNTGYYLTEGEANSIRKDPRVLDVSLNIKDSKIDVVPFGYLNDQYSDLWRKSTTTVERELNWGLLRCFEGQTRPDWGADAFKVKAVSGEINLTNIGRNVDVIVADGIINPNNPEFALNFDGTGGTRVIRYNWYQHNPEVKGTAAGTYIYTSFLTAANAPNNNHGTHVAGTCVGNTQGWARAANIYNIYVYSGDPYLFAYINAFHRSKPVNPITGVKNPTIVNMSFGLVQRVLKSTISAIKYRGNIYTKPATGWTTAQLKSYGVWGYATSFNDEVPLNTRYTPYEADILDGIDEGIIWLGAAGNDTVYIDVPGGLDYDNMISSSGTGYFYHRGSTPASGPGVITVGSIGEFFVESKADYSNSGPRIDIFAPGSQIMSTVLINSEVHDYRNYSYLVGKLSGTSMATPQVTGVLACVLEIFPHLKQQDCLNYIQLYSTKDQIYDQPFLYVGFLSLNNAPNYYLKHRGERNRIGTVYPKNNHLRFKQGKQLFPTVKIRRKG